MPAGASRHGADRQRLDALSTGCPDTHPSPFRAIRIHASKDT
jgi:hypothetical protein